MEINQKIELLRQGCETLFEVLRHVAGAISLPMDEALSNIFQQLKDAHAAEQLPGDPDDDE